MQDKKSDTETENVKTVKDDKFRKWQLTFNNPKDHGYSHDAIKAILNTMSIKYWCMCDEIGENGTYHTHLYFVANNAVRFSTVQKKFSGAHIEPTKGSSQQNRDYIRKEGKYIDTEKAATNLKDTFEELGELPDDSRQGSRTDMSNLYTMIKEGLSDYEIIETNAEYINKLETVDKVRQSIRYEQYKDVFRVLTVTYISGETGTGKTRHVMEKYGYSNVYRVTDYEHPFDSYKGQDVVVFEEFRSSLRIADMLNYLDGYPCELPCRYNNKIACFTQVYILSNIPLSAQYENIQADCSATFRAFLRRIHHVYLVTPYGEMAELFDDNNKLGGAVVLAANNDSMYNK